MLVDGNSLTYRAFFALPTDMATASGQVTNAVYGFTSMLINLWRDHEPDSIVIAFDRPEPTFRHEMAPTYKANRDTAPDILRQQMGLVREVVDALALPTIDMAGFEADDVIATLAAEGRDRGDDVIIVTGDRDAYQLVEDPHVKVLYNKRGVSDYVLYDEAGIKDRTGVVPTDYVQYAALRGDNSDNLPGVPGVGEKTAAKLVNERGGIDGIFESLDELTPKLRENLAANEDNVRRNVEMMKLVRNVDLDRDLDDLQRGEIDRDEVRKLFDFLEFRSLHERLDEVLGESTAAAAEVLEAEVTAYETAAEAVSALAAAASGDDALAMAVGPGGLDDGLAFVVDGEAAEVGFVSGDLLDEDDVAAELANLVGLGGRSLAMHGAKPLMRDLLSRGIDVRDLAVDSMLAAYLLDPADTRYDLGELLVRFTGMELPTEGAPEGQLDLEGEAIAPALAAGRTALALDRLVGPLRDAMAARDCSSSTTTSRSRSSGSWPEWRRSGSGSTRRC